MTSRGPQQWWPASPTTSPTDEGTCSKTLAVYEQTSSRHKDGRTATEEESSSQTSCCLSCLLCFKSRCPCCARGGKSSTFSSDETSCSGPSVYEDMHREYITYINREETNQSQADTAASGGDKQLEADAFTCDAAEQNESVRSSCDGNKRASSACGTDVDNHKKHLNHKREVGDSRCQTQVRSDPSVNFDWDTSCKEIYENAELSSPVTTQPGPITPVFMSETQGKQARADSVKQRKAKTLRKLKRYLTKRSERSARGSAGSTGPTPINLLTQQQCRGKKGIRQEAFREENEARRIKEESQEKNLPRPPLTERTFGADTPTGRRSYTTSSTQADDWVPEDVRNQSLQIFPEETPEYRTKSARPSSLRKASRKLHAQSSKLGRLKNALNRSSNKPWRLPDEEKKPRGFKSPGLWCWSSVSRQRKKAKDTTVFSGLGAGQRSSAPTPSAPAGPTVEHNSQSPQGRRAESPCASQLQPTTAGSDVNGAAPHGIAKTSRSGHARHAPVTLHALSLLAAAKPSVHAPKSPKSLGVLLEAPNRQQNSTTLDETARSGASSVSSSVTTMFWTSVGKSPSMNVQQGAASHMSLQTARESKAMLLTTTNRSQNNFCLPPSFRTCCTSRVSSSQSHVAPLRKDSPTSVQKKSQGMKCRNTKCGCLPSRSAIKGRTKSGCLKTCSTACLSRDNRRGTCHDCSPGCPRKRQRNRKTAARCCKNVPRCQNENNVAMNLTSSNRYFRMNRLQPDAIQSPQEAPCQSDPDPMWRLRQGHLGVNQNSLSVRDALDATDKDKTNSPQHTVEGETLHSPQQNAEGKTLQSPQQNAEGKTLQSPQQNAEGEITAHSLQQNGENEAALSPQQTEESDTRHPPQQNEEKETTANSSQQTEDGDTTPSTRLSLKQIAGDKASTATRSSMRHAAASEQNTAPQPAKHTAERRKVCSQQEVAKRKTATHSSRQLIEAETASNLSQRAEENIKEVAYVPEQTAQCEAPAHSLQKPAEKKAIRTYSPRHPTQTRTTTRVSLKPEDTEAAHFPQTSAEDDTRAPDIAGQDPQTHTAVQSAKNELTTRSQQQSSSAQSPQQSSSLQQSSSTRSPQQSSSLQQSSSTRSPQPSSSRQRSSAAADGSKHLSTAPAVRAGVPTGVPTGVSTPQAGNERDSLRGQQSSLEHAVEKERQSAGPPHQGQLGWTAQRAPGIRSRLLRRPLLFCCSKSKSTEELKPFNSVAKMEDKDASSSSSRRRFKLTKRTKKYAKSKPADNKKPGRKWIFFPSKRGPPSSTSAHKKDSKSSLCSCHSASVQRTHSYVSAKSVTTQGSSLRDCPSEMPQNKNTGQDGFTNKQSSLKQGHTSVLERALSSASLPRLQTRRHSSKPDHDSTPSHTSKPDYDSTLSHTSKPDRDSTASPLVRLSEAVKEPSRGTGTGEVNQESTLSWIRLLEEQEKDKQTRNAKDISIQGADIPHTRPQQVCETEQQNSSEKTSKSSAQTQAKLNCSSNRELTSSSSPEEGLSSPLNVTRKHKTVAFAELSDTSVQPLSTTENEWSSGQSSDTSVHKLAKKAEDTELTSECSDSPEEDLQIVYPESHYSQEDTPSEQEEGLVGNSQDTAFSKLASALVDELRQHSSPKHRSLPSSMKATEEPVRAAKISSMGRRERMWKQAYLQVRGVDSTEVKWNVFKNLVSSYASRFPANMEKQMQAVPTTAQPILRALRDSQETQTTESCQQPPAETALGEGGAPPDGEQTHTADRGRPTLMECASHSLSLREWFSAISTMQDSSSESSSRASGEEPLSQVVGEEGTPDKTDKDSSPLRISNDDQEHVQKSFSDKCLQVEMTQTVGESRSQDGMAVETSPSSGKTGFPVNPSPAASCPSSASVTPDPVTARRQRAESRGASPLSTKITPDPVAVCRQRTESRDASPTPTSVAVNPVTACRQRTEPRDEQSIEAHVPHSKPISTEANCTVSTKTNLPLPARTDTTEQTQTATSSASAPVTHKRRFCKKHACCAKSKGTTKTQRTHSQAQKQ